MAWEYLSAGCDWRRGAPVPPVSDEVVGSFIEENPGDDRLDAIECLTLDPRSQSGGNDIALCLAPTTFNGDRFSRSDMSIVALNAFVEKHGLTLHEACEGYLY